MRTVLQSLRHWGVITATVTVPMPIDPAILTADETSAIKAFQVCHITDCAKYVLGTIGTPKTAWKLLEKHFGTKAARAAHDKTPALQVGRQRHDPRPPQQYG